MTHCDHDQPSTPEMDATVARVAMGERDYPHAAYHVASALASDPHRPDLLALLDQLVAAAGGIEPGRELFSLEGGTWYGIAAVHARLLADADPTNALDLLCQVAAARPDVPYLPWARAWLDRVDAGTAATSFSRLLAVNAAPGTPQIEGAVVPALELLAELRRLHPEQAGLWAISSMLTRRAGRPEQAWELARTAFERFPSWNSAVALANACRAVDRWDDAQEAWRAALSFEPGDVSVRLDWGDALLDRWELELARAKYQEVLDLQPEHPWATPSALYVDWARSSTVAARMRLADYAEAHPDNHRARDLADRATPWVGRLPSPQEATLNVMAQVREQPEHAAGELTLQMSHLESPSSQVAARRFLEQHGGKLVLTVSEVAAPDQRVPVGEPRWVLWRWDGTDATPALPPPADPRVGQVLAKLASSAYHSAGWLQRGVELARQHGIEVLTLAMGEDLLRAALHPPAGPSWSAPWDWAHRVTHAAAFVASGYPGWEGTVQQDVIRSMLAARNDWFAVAGAIAAAERARTDDEVRTELRARIMDLLRDGPDGGYWCVGWPAVNALVRMGVGDDDELRDTLLHLLQGYEDPQPEDAEAEATSESAGADG